MIQVDHVLTKDLRDYPKAKLPLLIVTSEMETQGETGVQTHFNSFITYLDEIGNTCLFVGPREARTAYQHLKLLTGVIGRSMPISKQLSRFGLRYMTFYTTRRELKRRLDDLSMWCIYAQDPTTARAALSLRKTSAQRVILAVHYNVSQAEEMTERGIIKKGSWLYRKIIKEEKVVLEAVDEIITFSTFMSNRLSEKITLTRNVIKVIPNTACLSESTSDVVARDLIAIGSLEPRKNQEFLLRVLAEAKRMDYQYTLTLVGSGEDMKRLQLLSAELGVENQVFFLGRRANAASLLPAHKLLVHAARIENMPIALIEALAAGVPIIAPCVGGIPEVFSDHIEGRFWNLDDVNKSAILLVSLLEDKHCRDQMGLAARQRYLNYFSNKQVFESICKIIYGY